MWPCFLFLDETIIWNAILVILEIPKCFPRFVVMSCLFQSKGNFHTSHDERVSAKAEMFRSFHIPWKSTTLWMMIKLYFREGWLSTPAGLKDGGWLDFQGIVIQPKHTASSFTFFTSPKDVQWVVVGSPLPAFRWRTRFQQTPGTYPQISENSQYERIPFINRRIRVRGMFLGYVGIFFEKINAWEEKNSRVRSSESHFCFQKCHDLTVHIPMMFFKKCPWKFKDYHGPRKNREIHGLLFHRPKPTINH